MGILKNITDRLWQQKKSAAKQQADHQQHLRKCYFEVMEQRRVLSADPVVAAITFREGDLGLDTQPDYFEVTFQGGSATTQLTQFTINGDQDLSGGRTLGDIFFDHSGSGAGGFFPFQFDASRSVGITADDILDYSYSNDDMVLTVTLQNFFAGDRFAFTIDVDEVERLRTDMIVSGTEFEGTFFQASFEDAHYTFARQHVELDVQHSEDFIQRQWSGAFFDDYDVLFAHGGSLANSTLDLRGDNWDGQANRTAGSIDVYQLTPRPIVISGTVHHDENLNCEFDSNEQGIANVLITLQRWNSDSQSYIDVATTTTDVNGHYVFGESLNLMPGTYQLVQTQPSEYLSVGAKSGSEGGLMLVDSNGHPNIISDIQITLGGTVATDYRFCEVLPAEISGIVWHDANDDGVLDASEERIGGVRIQLFDVSGKLISETQTDPRGNYSFTQLMPGTYSVNQIQPANFLDGKESLGFVTALDGTTHRQGEMRTNDRFDNIMLRAGDRGVQYNFGELRAASISGRVHADIDGNCVFEPSAGDRPLANVELILQDQFGIEIARTVTDQNGDYIFDGLRPGTYSVRQIQPEGYLDGSASVGNVAGQAFGFAGTNLLSGITLTSGDAAVRYDFCEHVPSEICGVVWHDRNNDGIRDRGEEGIANVRIVLMDADGNIISETTTDAQGRYCFVDLVPGEYSVKQFQPEGWVDGKDSLGMVDGQSRGEQQNDKFVNIRLRGGEKGTDYNFGEIKLSEISGFVHVDVGTHDCIFDASQGDYPLANVQMQLLNQSGQVIATTTTDANGFYAFVGLLPGSYSVRQIQPDGLFSGGEKIGDGDGVAETNLLRGITIQSDQILTQYNFCELDAAEIHGRVWEDGPAFETPDGLPPENYRQMRDGIYDPAVDTALPGVRMQLYFFVDPSLANDPDFVGDLSPRPVTLADVLPEFYGHLGTSDPTAPIWTLTDVNGQYSFQGLRPGSYIVLQEQPDGFVDGNDFPGTTTGFSFNSFSAAQTAPQSLLQMFGTQQLMDSIINVQVASNGVSLENNFTEVRVVQQTSPPEPPKPPEPPRIPPRETLPPGFGNPQTPAPGLTFFPGLAGSMDPGFRNYVGPPDRLIFQMPSGGPQQAYSWHLSVINAGQPRHEADGLETGNAWQQVSFIGNQDWSRLDMNQAIWTFATVDEHGKVKIDGQRVAFGMIDGTPLVGDFNGNGRDQIAVFKDGNWLIDINNNGIWDENDLLIKFGSAEDRPVIGDWDGDGKDDVGIYGPMWEHDLAAIAREPGLPNPDNHPITRPKNVPPHDQEATNRARVMKLTTFGQQRADVVDHVFGLGDSQLIPVAGDWNGNGIRSIGTFKDGVWQLDLNGDGKFDHRDAKVRFGQAGDIPIVGDFNGDGIDQIAIYRSGVWIIDSDGNRELDATDLTFRLGGAYDQPIVGDFNGDGIDQPAIYSAKTETVY